MIQGKLSSFLKTKSGTTPLTTRAEFYEGGDIPWINSGELSQGILRDCQRHVTDIAVTECHLAIIPKQSTLIAMYGATAGDVGFLTFDTTINQAICAILPDVSIADPSYIYYYFKSRSSALKKLASGSARSNISQETIKNLQLLIPPIEQQHDIAGLLSTIDKLNECINTVSLCASKIISLVYDYWFVQFDFPDENGRPYKSSGGRMVYNDQLKKEIPEGWEAKKLLDLFSFERGTEVGSAQYSNYKVNDNYVKFYRVRDVGDDSSTWVSKENDLQIVKPGDVVITLDGTVGKTGIDIDGAISGGLRHAVDNSRKISSSMIWSILNSYYIQESLRRYVSGRGSILAHAGGAINDLSIPYSEHIFKKFQNVTDPMFALMVNCQQESKLLASLRDWLLPMLMNGQIEIKDEQQE